MTNAQIEYDYLVNKELICDYLDFLFMFFFWLLFFTFWLPQSLAHERY